MRILSKPRLRAFWEKHPDAQTPLLAWWKTALRSDWSSIQDLRATYPHADAVTLRSGLVVTVFNIGGDEYRLVARIIYEYRRIYVKLVLTHAEYDRDAWKEKLCRS
jgi:mRNA interferase HigB